MRGILIKHSLFFKIYDYFVYDVVEYHDDICDGLKEKMEKMQLRRLYTNSKEAPTEEECEAVRTEYLERIGQ